MKVNTRAIEIFRARKGWTKAKLAEESGVNTVSYALRRGSCSAPTLKKIADALGVDVTEIMA